MKISAGTIKTISLSLSKLDESLEEVFETLNNDFTFEVLRVIVKSTNIEIELDREDRYNKETVIKEIKEFIQEKVKPLGVTRVVLPDGTSYTVSPYWPLKLIQKELSTPPLSYKVPEEGEKINDTWYVGSAKLRESFRKKCYGIVG